MPGAQSSVRHGRARQSSGTGPCRDCIRVLLVPGPWGQHWGKLWFIENIGYKTRGRHVATRRSDTRVAYPEVKIQVRDLM